MTHVEDDKAFKEEPLVQVLSDNDSEVKEVKDGGEEVTGGDGEGEANVEEEDEDGDEYKEDDDDDDTDDGDEEEV